MLILLASLLLLTLTSCKGKEDAAKLPSEEIKAQVPTFAPLPSFKEVFRLLENLEAKDYALTLTKQPYRIKQEGPNNAFALGVLTADAVISAKARNKKQLSEISSEMMNLTTLLGLEDEINRLGAELKTLIQQEKWEELDGSLDAVKKKVEDKLWELENYEYYTLMIMGGWTEVLNSVSKVLATRHSAEATKAISQVGTWNSMKANFELMSSPEIKDTQMYETVGDVIPKISQILGKHSNNTYSKEQLDELIKLTDQILRAFPTK